MDPITIIAVTVLVILLVYVVTHGGVPEPGRTIFIAVLGIGILLAILKLLGLW